MRIEIPQALTYCADREDLEELLGNLLENAFKWATHRIVVGASATEAHLLLFVDDDGPGIESRDAARAATRGIRLDEHIPGSGLGLSIVTDIAAIYGGELQLSRAELGGLRAAVRLPGGAANLDPGSEVPQAPAHR